MDATEAIDGKSARRLALGPETIKEAVALLVELDILRRLSK